MSRPRETWTPLDAWITAFLCGGLCLATVIASSSGDVFRTVMFSLGTVIAWAVSFPFKDRPNG